MKLNGARSRTGITFTRQEDGSFLKAAPVRAIKTFDAASFSRLTGDWQVSRLSADAELQGKLEILRSRSRDHEQNEPLAESYLKLRENNVVGDDGFTLQMKVVASETLDPETGARKITLDHAASRAVERGWVRFCQKANFLVTRDLHAIEACKLMERTWQRDGDFLIRKVTGAPNEFGFALQLLEADYLDDRYIDFRGVPCNCPSERTLPDGRPFPPCERGLHEVRMGVELHGDWKFPVAYWLLANHPGDYFFGNQYATRRIRVPIEEIIHPFTKKRIEQTRGIPAAVAAMFRLQQMGGMNEAAVVGARAAAEKMGVITKTIPQDFQCDDGYVDGTLGRTITSAPGEMLELPMGYDAKPLDWKMPDDTYGSFLETQQYDVSATLGVACHSLTGNLAKVNFSTARIGDTQQRDTFRGGQGSFIRDILLEVFPAWLQSAMLVGIVDVPFSKYAACIDAEAVCFHGRGFEYFDPQNDVEADLAAIEGNLETRAAIIAKRTRRDFEEVAAELAREKQILDAAGLGEPTPAPAGSAAPAKDSPAIAPFKSAHLGDITLGELPEEAEATVRQFVPGVNEHSIVTRYGMTVPELLDKADQHNLDTARHHLRNAGVRESKVGVLERKDKYVLLLNDRIIDGHHHLAKAEKGKVTSSLPVLDLSPLRYQNAGDAAAVKTIIGGKKCRVGKDCGATCISTDKTCRCSFIAATTHKEVLQRLAATLTDSGYLPKYYKQPASVLDAKTGQPKKGVFGEKHLKAMSLDRANALLEHLEHLGRKCDELKIPRIRQIRIVETNKVAGSMGDGVLTLSANTVQQFDAAKELTEPISAWKWGDVPMARPFLGSQYLKRTRQRALSTIEHEFGHHVHQQVGTMLTNRQPLISGAPADRKCASRYGDKNTKEWFAENWAMLRTANHSRLDHVDSSFDSWLKQHNI